MLEVKTINARSEAVEEVTTLPRLTSIPAKTIDSPGEATPRHSTGRDLQARASVNNFRSTVVGRNSRFSAHRWMVPRESPAVG